MLDNIHTFPGQKTLSEKDLFRKIPAPDRNIVDFRNLDPGAPSAVRVKFATGFFRAVVHVRQNKPRLDAVSRVDRSIPFLAGYDVGLVFGAGLETTVQQQGKMDEAFRMWLGAHTGTDATMNVEATAERHTREGKDYTTEDRTGGGEQPDLEQLLKDAGVSQDSE